MSKHVDAFPKKHASRMSRYDKFFDGKPWIATKDELPPSGLPGFRSIMYTLARIKHKKVSIVTHGGDIYVMAREKDNS